MTYIQAVFKKPLLTDRELEVLALVAHGYTRVEIQGVLHICRGTVDSHMVNIRAKLQTSERGALASWYRWNVQPAYLWDYRL